MAINNGLFIIADITGYTAFLTQSELDHANEILESLFDTLLKNIKAPLIISNFQGDAIFSYVPQENLTHGQTLLEIVENLYFEFLHILDYMHQNTTCNCKACRNMSSLDLKIFIHYGSFFTQTMRGREELSGPDVIIAHRMMKNQVAAETGIQAYALLTESAVEALELGDLVAEMKPHQEIYEHIGEIRMFVHDLRPAWERERHKRRVFLSQEEALFFVEVDLPAPPPIAWEFISHEEYKQQWLDMLSIRRIDGQPGRKGIGSRFHCAHAVGDSYYSIVDWQPFEYMTMTSKDPSEEFEYIVTYVLTPTELGSHFSSIWGVSKRVDNENELREFFLQQTLMHMALLKNLVATEMVKRQSTEATSFGIETSSESLS